MKYNRVAATNCPKTLATLPSIVLYVPTQVDTPVGTSSMHTTYTTNVYMMPSKELQPLYIRTPTNKRQIVSCPSVF